jgi:hypothetical protein
VSCLTETEANKKHVGSPMCKIKYIRVYKKNPHMTRDPMHKVSKEFVAEITKEKLQEYD